MDPQKKYIELKGVVRLCFAVFIFIMAMEVCARIDDGIKYDAPILGEYNSSRLRNRDDEGIRRNVPNSRFEKWQINSFGFRGPEIQLSKPQSIKRIACMGQSETFGLYEDPGKEWPVQLAGMLQKRGMYEVINASVVGMSFKHWKRYIEKYVIKFDPDIIILYINATNYALKDVRVPIGTDDQNKKLKNITKKRKQIFRDIEFDIRVFPKIKLTMKKIGNRSQNLY